MPPLLLVMAGGAVGAGLRYQVGALALRALGPGFPWGTWIVNLSGGLMMGMLAGVLAREAAPSGEPLRLLVGVGILGGFTTFSAFSLESHAMLLRGDYVPATAYAISSVVGSIAALAMGVQLVRLAA